MSQNGFKQPGSKCYGAVLKAFGPKIWKNPFRSIEALGIWKDLLSHGFYMSLSPNFRIHVDVRGLISAPVCSRWTSFFNCSGIIPKTGCEWSNGVIGLEIRYAYITCRWARNECINKCVQIQSYFFRKRICHSCLEMNYSGASFEIILSAYTF